MGPFISKKSRLVKYYSIWPDVMYVGGCRVFVKPWVFSDGKPYSNSLKGIILKPLGFPHVLAVFSQGPNMYAYHV